MLVVIVAVAGAFVVLRRGPVQEQSGGTTGENVWFRIEANFTYRGSSENLPIENVALRFPYPNVEKAPPFRQE